MKRCFANNLWDGHIRRGKIALMRWMRMLEKAVADGDARTKRARRKGPRTFLGMAFIHSLFYLKRCPAAVAQPVASRLPAGSKNSTEAVLVNESLLLRN